MAGEFFLDVIRDAIDADFVARARVSEVLIGEWSVVEKYPGDVVILGLGDGDGQAIGADAHHYGPGEVDQGDGTSARALAVNVQRVIVWCAARPALDATDRKLASSARAATWALARATIAAIWRWHGGTFPFGSIKWLNEERGSRIYGGALRFEALFPLPIWDDADPLIVLSSTAGTAEFDTGAGPVAEQPPKWSDP